MLFDDADFSYDDSEGFEDDEEVWEVGGPFTTVAEGQSFTLPSLGFHVPSSMIKDLSTHKGNSEYGHGQLVKKVIQLSDAEVADGIAIEEIDPRVFDGEGHVQGQLAATQQDEVISTLSQQVQILQAAVQQRDVQIWRLQTVFFEMSSRESTLM
nr:hypothetical protein [Tanacetum cinerariifolium]